MENLGLPKTRTQHRCYALHKTTATGQSLYNTCTSPAYILSSPNCLRGKGVLWRESAFARSGKPDLVIFAREQPLDIAAWRIVHSSGERGGAGE